jgi:hypothetical protein
MMDAVVYNGMDEGMTATMTMMLQQTVALKSGGKRCDG